MKRDLRLMRRFANSEDGSTAIEYALIAIFLAIMLAAALPPLSAALSGLFGALVTAFG
jgi:Flp pilus assembly pilin Flp